MKKHLIAAAISAAVAVPALAQVTVYGTIDAGVATVNKVGTTTATSTNQRLTTSNYMTTNRLGFRGEEDLGGGLKGIFGIESGFSGDNTSALDLGSRGAFVGATGAFGSVRIGGRMTSFVDNVATAAVGTAGNISNLTAHGLISLAQGARPANSVVYETPTFSGVRGQFVVGNGESATAATKNNGNYQSIGLTGKVGALSFTAVRASNRVVSGAGTATRCIAFLGNSTGSGTNSTIGYGPTDGSCSVTRYATISTAADQWSANSTGTGFGAGINSLLAQGVDQFVVLSAGARATGAFDYKTEETGLALAYDFGMAALTYQTIAQKTTGNLGVGTTASATLATNTAVDRRVQGITLTVPMGALTPFANYQEMDDKTQTDNRNDVDAVAVGVTYALSKRTSAYAVYSQLDRGTAATTTHRGAGAAGVAGTKSTSTAIGLRHSF